MKLGPDQLDLLRHLDPERRRSLGDLHGTLGGPRSTVRYWLSALEDAGLVGHERQKGFFLTPAGLARRDRPQDAPIEEHPRLPLPNQVRELPEVHQALIELIVCAAAVRFHRCATSKLASFLLFGQTQRLKTAVAEVAIVLAGGQTRQQVISLFNETTASATMRRDAKGRTKLRGAAKRPVLCLDEFHEADGDVRQACFLYMFGESTLAGEDDPVEVPATTVVTMNSPTPRAGQEPTIEFLTGLQPSRQRRMIMANMTPVKIPERLAGTRVEEIVQQLQESGPHELPKPRHPDYVPADRVRQILTFVLNSAEHLELINSVLVARIVAGATAYLHDKEQALRNVMWNVALCYETLGWLRPDWRERMPIVLAGDVPVELQPEAEAPVDADAEPVTVDPVSVEVARQLTRIQRRVEELGISYDEALERIEGPRVVERACTPEEEEAVELLRLAKRLGLDDPQRRELALRLGAEGLAYSLWPGNLKTLGRALLHHAPPGWSFADAIDHLLELLDRHGSLKQAIDAAELEDEERARRARQRLEEARRATDGQRRMAESYGELLAGLAEAIAEAKELPNAGPIVRELETLRESHWLRRLASLLSPPRGT